MICRQSLLIRFAWSCTILLAAGAVGHVEATCLSLSNFYRHILLKPLKYVWPKYDLAVTGIRHAHLTGSYGVSVPQ